jgi:hypothetical protein
LQYKQCTLYLLNMFKLELSSHLSLIITYMLHFISCVWRSVHQSKNRFVPLCEQISYWVHCSTENKCFKTLMVCGLWWFNATFNNISDILWWSVLLMKETWRKPPTYRKSLINFIIYHLSWIRTHNVSGDRHWLHR